MKNKIREQLPIQKAGKPWVLQTRKPGTGKGKLGKFKPTGNPEFNAYVEDVRANIHKDYPSLIKQANGVLGIKAIKAELSGSYARGNPNEDSDIDIKIYYSGKASPEEVAAKLSGNLQGKYGLYDAHAEKI